jgi:hypothetical protein
MMSSLLLASGAEPCSVLVAYLLFADCSQGAKPIVFFTRTGKLNVRMALTSGLLAKADASGKGKDKLKWGLKLKLEIKKPIIAMAAHPSDNQLLLLLEDGSLKGYVMTSTGLSSIYPAAYMLPCKYS